MKNRRIRHKIPAFLLAAGLLLTTTFPATAAEGDTVIAYDNLSDLVLQNQKVQSTLENYTTNKSNYESLISSLTEERDYMKLMVEKYKDTDEEAKGTYQSNASALNSSISRLKKQLENLDSSLSQTSRQKTLNAYVLTAQNLMNTYNQMAVNATAKEKSAQAAEASYQAMVKKQSAGMATAAEVLEAADNLSQQKNQRDSYTQQTSQARFNLLSALGMDTDSQVTIGAIPTPDTAAIAAIDFASDVEKAVGNSSSVQSARSGSAGTYAEIDRKAKQEEEAVGTVRANLQDSYNQLQADALNYQSALDSFESASIIWQSTQRKKQAGMVDQTTYLEGEATYLEALAAKETASMNLYQSYEGYLWEVAGVS